MKNNFKVAMAIIIAVTMLLTQVKAQFTLQGGNNWFINGATPVDRLNLGTGTTFNYAFFIDGANLSSSNTGNVFGTDCPAATATYWKMYMGGTHIADWWNGGSGNELNIGTIQTTSSPHLNFYTANAQRMTILGSGTAGHVGINLTAPKNFLHIDGGTSTAAYSQFTNSVTNNNTATTGFVVGVDANGNAILNSNYQHASNGNMLFSTAGTTPSMTILGNTSGTHGFVCISNTTTTPARHLEVVDGTSDQLRLTYSGTTSTDFQTTSNGYLRIEPSGDRVSINTAPNSAVTLDLNPNGSDDPIRLRSLDNASDANILCADANGVVNYRTDIVNNSCGSASQYYVPKFCSPSTGIVNSQIYDNSFIGMNATSTTQNSFLNAVAPSGYNGMYVSGNYTGAGNTHGLWVNNVGGTSNNAGSYNAGLEAHCNVTSVGGGSSNPINYGILTSSLSSNTNGINIGIDATANGAATNFGVAGIADGDEEYNIGVYGRGNEDDDDWAAYFDGDTHCTDGVWESSDGELKENVEDLTDAMTLLEQLQPKTYNFKTQDYPQMGLPSTKQYGFLADDVASVVPELVRAAKEPATFDGEGNQITPEVDYSTLNYIHLIPILVGALQELKAQVDACDCGEGLRSSNPNDGNGQSINLVSKEQIQLGNATPNPNGGITSIPFHLPKSVVKAEMVFTDLLGQEVNRVELGARGFSQINVTTTQLEDGTYNYTLIADGKVIDTKQMVKAH